MNVTYLPPSEPRPNLHFDKAQFGRRRQFPVEAHYVSMRNAPTTNGWRSTGISFADYGNMQTQTRKTVGAERRLNIPEYVLDEKRFRSVVVRFLEFKAGLQKRQLGTEAGRMQRVSARLKQKAEAAVVTLDKFCARYVAASDDAERKRFQRNIEEYDTTVRLCREPWAIPQMARAYYFERINSVEVGARLGFKSCHVRQILKRLSDLDAKMQAGTDVPKRSTGRPRTGNGQQIAAHTRHIARGIILKRCHLCVPPLPLFQLPVFSGEELRA